MKYSAPSVVPLTPKHGLRDCVISALASYLEKPYEEVVAAASRVYPNFYRCGLENKHAVKVAHRLGAKVKWVQHYDIDEDSGVLGIHYIVGTSEHAVLLLDGHIYELEDRRITRWDPDAYLAVHGAKPGHLLVKMDP